MLRRLHLAAVVWRDKHAFANETVVGDRKLPIAEYSAPAAELAWTRTMESSAAT